jgi:hypothetical protein
MFRKMQKQVEIAGSELWALNHLHTGDFTSPPTRVVTLISGLTLVCPLCAV